MSTENRSRGVSGVEDADDPLDRLRALIGRAAAPTDEPRSEAFETRSTADSPLKRVADQIDRARRVAQNPESYDNYFAPDALGRLQRLIERAKPPYHLEQPDARAGAENPIERLEQLVQSEIESHGKIPVVTHTDVSVSGRHQGSRDKLERMVGRHVLESLRRKPLPGEARRYLVERTAAELERTDDDVFSDLLDVLVTGDVPDTREDN